MDVISAALIYPELLHPIEKEIYYLLWVPSLPFLIRRSTPAHATSYWGAVEENCVV